VLFVNGFRRATSPPETIASITNNPVRQGRLGLVRCFLKSANMNKRQKTGGLAVFIASSPGTRN